METQYRILNQDISLLCVKAESFPDGIQAAFNELKKRIPQNDARKPYGISKPERDGTIVYRAGVEQAFEGEAAQQGCETVIIKKGKYLSKTVTQWQTKMETLGSIFEELLSDPRLDPDSPCVEIYQSQTELICMVRIIKM
ncbi:MAG: transcriptional regulator [Bacteroidota bacterium]